MALDPQVKTLLDQMASLGGPPLHELGVTQARALLEGFAAIGGPPAEMARVEDRTFAGPAGDVPVRIYRPTDDAGPQPALVWFHGGGFVLGSIEVSDHTCRELAAQAGVVVVSVDYRLAPEHPYPGGVDDCYAAVVWVVATAGDLGIDPARVAVGGDSAGGNLAAVVALAARDRGGPGLRFQLLVYPVTDLLMSYPSVRDNGQGYMLTADSMKWFHELYLGERGDPKDPLVSPLYAEDLSGLPPALVITAEFDPLRDEGEAYGARLQQAQVAAKVSRYDGMIHGFFSMGAIVDAARPATAEAADALQRALGMSEDRSPIGTSGTDVAALLGRIGDSISGHKSFGPAFEKDGVLVIPVAYVFGGGGGGDGEEPGKAEADRKKGSGGGFGLLTWPIGAYVVQDGQVRWMPIVDPPLLMLTGAVAMAMVIRSLRKRRRRAHRRDHR